MLKARLLFSINLNGTECIQIQKLNKRTFDQFMNCELYGMPAPSAEIQQPEAWPNQHLRTFECFSKRKRCLTGLYNLLKICLNGMQDEKKAFETLKYIMNKILAWSYQIWTTPFKQLIYLSLWNWVGALCNRKK